MINKASVPYIDSLLKESSRVAIVVHRGPDGDAIGSGLGFKHLLSQLNLDVTVIAPDEFPHFLKWLPESENILVYERERSRAEKALKKADVVFCLDFNSLPRTGCMEEFLGKLQKPFVVIDHHKDPDTFADHYYVDDEASSTAELVYRLAKALNLRKYVNRTVAICLYTGIVTDTGSFRYPSVSPKLLRIASRLLETGMDHTAVYSNVFDSNTLERLRLQGFALSEKLVYIPEAATAFISLTEEELERFKFQKGDTEGLVNYGLSINGVNLAAFFSEKDGIIKCSFRSKGSFDVNLFAREHFQGGGHKNAAGGKSTQLMSETITKFKDLVLGLALEIKAS
jgi:phosphoesterase RecJ-like protein